VRDDYRRRIADRRPSGLQPIDVETNWGNNLPRSIPDTETGLDLQLLPWIRIVLLSRYGDLHKSKIWSSLDLLGHFCGWLVRTGTRGLGNWIFAWQPSSCCNCRCKQYFFEVSARCLSSWVLVHVHSALVPLPKQLNCRSLSVVGSKENIYACLPRNFQNRMSSGVNVAVVSVKRRVKVAHVENDHFGNSHLTRKSCIDHCQAD